MAIKNNRSKTMRSKSKNRSKKIMRGGSGSLTQIRSTIKEKMGFKRITDKHCLKELERLNTVFDELNTAYKTLETAHKKAMREYNAKYREYQSETATEHPNHNRLSIREGVFKDKGKMVNVYRAEMNNIYMLVKRLRCVLIKYFYTKVPDHLVKLFEEYSEIFGDVKKHSKHSGKIMDLALIKDCFNFYMENRDKKNYKFVSELAKDLRMSSERSRALYKASGEKLRHMFAEHCNAKKMDDEVIGGHRLKFHDELDVVSATVVPQSAYSQSLTQTVASLSTMTNASVRGRKPSKKGGKNLRNNKRKPKKTGKRT